MLCYVATLIIILTLLNNNFQSDLVIGGLLIRVVGKLAMEVFPAECSDVRLSLRQKLCN